MANKPFSIQESKLRIAGVDLEAGNTGVVIPGVTRATTYKVEEINDTGDQTYQFAPDTEGAVVVIDAALYNIIVAQGNESGFADFTVTTDGEGFIDEIKINGQGSYTQLQATDAETSDMYAYVGAGNASDRPLVPQDWIQVPFRPRMRAGAIETIGGGGGSSITNSEESFAIDGDGNVIFDGPGPGGVNRGMEWQYGVNQNGVNSRIRQDDQGLTVRAWTENNIEGNYSAPVNIVTNQDMTENRWTFDGAGKLTLPVGGDIVDSNGTSVLGGGGGTPAVANTIKGWYSLQGRRPNNQNDAYYQSVTSDSTHIYTLGRSEYAYNDFEDNAAWVQKIEKSTGNVVWAKRIVAGHNASFQITIASGVVSVTAINNAGVGYQVEETLVIKGYNIGGGDPDGNILVRVDSVDEAGAILTASVSAQPTTPGTDGVYSASVYNNNNNTEPHSIAYDFDGEQIVVLVKTFIGQWSQEDSDIAYADVYVLDALTGAVNNTYTLKDLKDLDPVSIAVSPTGGQIAVVGEKYNEYRSFGTLNILATGNGYFDILKSNLDPEHYPGSAIPGDEYYNFFIQGTGIAYQRQVDNVNYYQGLATTTREGSGTVTVDVVCDGTGPYTYGAVTVQSGGANYVVGHKIKYLGTQIPGGTTPANDLILTVTGVDGSGAITTATASGTAPSNGTITGLTAGTNYQVGSGAQVNITVSPVTGLITGVATGNYGDYHYVVGDVLTVSGANFANGATPANDITLTVTDLFYNGPNAYTYTGTVPDSALRIIVNNVDFTAGGGSWSMRQTLGGETFIWTPTWNKAIGSSLDDFYNDVAFSQDGQSIYAVGGGQYEVNYQQALAVKFNANNGNIVWSKYLNSYLTPGSERSASGVSVVTLTNGNVVVGTGNQNNPDTGNNEITLVCLDTNGTLVWSRSFTDAQYGMNSWFGLSRDSDNAVYITYQQGTGNYSDAYNIIKVDGVTGSRVWARGFSNGSNGMYLAYNWGNNFATVSGTDIYVAGFTYVPNDNYYSSLLWKFPTDGFKDFNDAGYGAGQQFGDFRLYEIDITDYAQTQTPQTFTPTVHTGAITTSNNAKLFVAQSDNQQTTNRVVKMTLDSLGYVEFGDGSKQSFATNIIPQILGSNNQQIKLGPQDSGKHFFFDQNCTGATITIPPYDLEDFPVGYTVTIVNCSRGNVFVQMQNPDNGNWWWGTIQGSGRNLSTRRWGIPDSGSGSLVTLMKVKNAEFTGGENESGVQWIIAGPSDLYDDN